MSISSCIDYATQKIVRFSGFANQVSELVLDSLFFAGKVSPKVPSLVPELSLFGLSFIGITNLPYSVDLLGKTICDCLRGNNAGSRLVMIIASLKTVELASNIGLTCGNFAAASGGLIGNDDFQTTLYELMIPWSEAILALGFANLLIYLVMTKKAFSKLSQDAVENMETCRGSPDAACLRLCMDKDTLRHLNRTIHSIDPIQRQKLVKVVKDNLDTQLKWTQGGQLALTLIGYLLLGVEKYYTPNSLQAAGINLGMASAYTIKMAIELLREVIQRHKISQIAVGNNLIISV